MTSDTEKHIDEMRQRFDTLWKELTVEDFRRIHAKFVGAVISVECGFKKCFPEEAATYMKEFYGDDDGN